MSIRFEALNFTYSENTPFEYPALRDINLEITEGKVTAIIGSTGSGKSTLVQHLNALLIPTAGKVVVFDHVVEGGKENKGLKSLRKDVGLVFQFPEYQLFEETILKDVAFGPKNFGATEEEATAKAKEALKLVGLDESMYERSPLDLSGGQKRRVAIAGILAMDPKVLVLDEPTAGLDPQGAAKMMSLFEELNKQYHKTVLIVTHDMEQVLAHCDEVVVVKEGRIFAHQGVQEFFSNASVMTELGIFPPAIIRCEAALKEKGISLDQTYFEVEDLAQALAQKVKHHE